jgi:hypothetical protein
MNEIAKDVCKPHTHTHTMNDKSNIRTRVPSAGLDAGTHTLYQYRVKRTAIATLEQECQAQALMHTNTHCTSIEFKDQLSCAKRSHTGRISRLVARYQHW